MLSSETVKPEGAVIETEEPVKFNAFKLNVLAEEVELTQTFPIATEVGVVESVGTAACVVKLHVVQPEAVVPEFFGTTFQ